jgi:hypothetical protein
MTLRQGTQRIATGSEWDGNSAGAFHVASFLAHPEFQKSDSGVAGEVLTSGIYRTSADGGKGLAEPIRELIREIEARGLP